MRRLIEEIEHPRFRRVAIWLLPFLPELFLQGQDTCAIILLGVFGVAIAVKYFNDLGGPYLSNTGNRIMRFGVGERVLDCS
jgi:hypothetical protein